jgi:APA family basic amino acid/polyamine antiporter
VSVVILIIGIGGMFVSSEHWHPFIPANGGSFGEYGWSGVLRGAGVIFFAYIGFDAVSTAAQEARNPQRDMPRGILGSLLICTVLYVLVSGVMVGLVPYQQLGVPAPMALAVDAARVKAAGSSWQPIADVLPFIVKFGALMGLSSTIIVQMMAQPRIFYSMANDGLLPEWAARIHPRFKTPHLTTMITGGIVMLASGFTAIDVLGELVSIGTLFAFRHRLARRDRAAPDPPRSASAIPHAVRALAADCVSPCLARTDGGVASRDLGAIDYLDGDRTGDLLRIRTAAIEAQPNREPRITNHEP